VFDVVHKDSGEMEVRMMIIFASDFILLMLFKRLMNKSVSEWKKMFSFVLVC